MRLGWELNHKRRDHGYRENDALNHSATLQGCLAANKNFKKFKLDTGELAD